MNTIGKRIKFLRELQGLTQEDLADMLKIDRSILSNIERNDRNLKADEIIHFAQQLNVSANQLLGIDPLPEIILENTRVNVQPDQQKALRINVPAKNRKKFKEALLYILSKIGAKPNIGETVLFKLLYFMDFNHYERYEEQLIGATYIKNHFGPTPIEFKKIIEEMIAEHEIEKISSLYFKKDQKKYLPRREPNLAVFSGIEIKTIDEVLVKLSDMNAKAISEYSHADVPWMVASEGKPIDYETVFYRTPVYSVRLNVDKIQDAP